MKTKLIKISVLLLTLLVGFYIGKANQSEETQGLPRVIIDNWEHNHLIIRDKADIALDTIGNIDCIWYHGQPYYFGEL